MEFALDELPILRAAAESEQRVGPLVHRLGEELGLSEAAGAALLASGRQTVFANRMHWAKTHLSEAGLVNNPDQAHRFEVNRYRHAA